MKLICIFFIYALAVSAQSTAPTNYSVTSPVPNGPYVIGQILPCTWRIYPDTPDLVLEIDLVQGNTTTILTDSADVTKNNRHISSFYEHSFNYNIPSTVRPGNYQVVFKDKISLVNYTIPIEIRPESKTTTTSSRPRPTGSIFAQGAACSVKPTVLLLLVALAAFLL